MLTTVEKVLILQNVDIFEFVLTEGLSHIAMITDEISVDAGQSIVNEGDLPDAMYIVLEGQVRITREGRELMIVEEQGDFGTWGLFDDAPRVYKAAALAECQLLRIDREEFLEVLSDSAHITESVLKKITKRMKNLMDRLGM
jgi:CRP-like cAMP-binding protein